MRALSDVQPAGAALQLVRSLLELTKPSVTRMVMITMLLGALTAPVAIPWGRLLWALLGTALVVGAANALNMWLERETDKLMTRTSRRPLPEGRLEPDTALLFGLLLGALGLSLLIGLVNGLTAALAAFALASYVAVYTPLKRLTPWALHVGAVPGAIPPVLGYTAVTATLDARALALFCVLFLWQIPHFLAISIFRQREYEAAGIRVLPAVRGMPHTLRAVAGYSFLLLVGSLAPVAAGMAGPIYAVVALTCGQIFLAWALVGLRAASTVSWARSLFFASMPYLVILFAMLVVVNW
jgi:protoheme IX farnesyltransferase